MTSAPKTAAAAPRLWGSELLLRKVPIYAQARQYATVDADDAQSEGNTLGYGVSSYPLLACVRTAYEAVNGEAQPSSSTSSLQPADAGLIDRSPFSGIHTAGYAHVPAQRKWMSTSALAAEVASSATGAVVRRAAAAAVLDDALGPPTLAQVLEPWFGLIEDHLSTDGQTPVAAAEKEGDEGVPSERVIDADALRCRRRARLHERERETHGAVYTRLESALMHFSAATAEEKEVLRGIRVGSSEVDLSARDAAQQAATSTGVPPEAWGSRMLSLVTTAVASDGGQLSDEEVDQQQKVLAYLKRVRWIATQWSSASAASSLKDAAAAPSWSQLSEAARVKTEMQHTQGQRRRFRRVRRGPADGSANTDDVDATEE